MTNVTNIKSFSELNDRLKASLYDDKDRDMNVMHKHIVMIKTLAEMDLPVSAVHSALLEIVKICDSALVCTAPTVVK